MADWFAGRPKAADLRGFEKVEGILPEGDLGTTAAGRASKVGQTFAEPITPERMGVLRSALAQVNAPPPPKPPPIDRIMAAIAEGVRNPTYQNPPPNSRASMPKPSTFADLERAMGAAPSGQSTGAFNAVDMDQQLGRYLSSEYAGGGAREAAGIRGQTPPARSGVVNTAIQDFTQANPNLRSAFNNFNPDMSGGWGAAASDETLAQHLFGNPEAYLSGGPRQSLPAVIQSSRAGTGFTMNGPSSEWAPPQAPMKALPPPPPEPINPGLQAFMDQQARRGAMWDALEKIERPARVPVTQEIPRPIPKNLEPGLQAFLDQQAQRGEMWDALGKIQRPARVPVTQPLPEVDLNRAFGPRTMPGGGGGGASAAGTADTINEYARRMYGAKPTYGEDLRTVGNAITSRAGKVAGAIAAPFNALGARVMANPEAAAAVRVVAPAAKFGVKALPAIGMGLEALADPNAHDSVEQALGFDNLRASFDRGRSALAQGDYAGAGVEALKAIPKAAYAGTLKGGVALGDWLMGPPPAPLTAAQTKAKIAETAKGASLIDDDDTSDPIKNAARYEQIKAQREQRLQNEPTMNVRLRQAEGPMPDGSTPPQREVRLLADEVRNSPLRDEIMRAGVPTSGHVTASEAVANGRAGGAGGAGGPTDFESQLRNFISYADKNQVPLSLRNQIVAALGHAHGDDSLAPYHEAAALNYIAQAQPKRDPVRDAREQALARTQRIDYARAALRNPNIKPEERALYEGILKGDQDYVDDRLKIARPGDPNAIDLRELLPRLNVGQQ